MCSHNNGEILNASSFSGVKKEKTEILRQKRDNFKTEADHYKKIK